MILFPSMPHEADIMSFGFASSILIASSGGANPPNTTEWIAPMRAHASMAMSASGIIGIYRMTVSPLPAPQDKSAPANRETSSSNSP